MKQNLLDKIQARRSHYQLGKQQAVPDSQLLSQIEQVVLHAPSAFNTQTARIVVLMGEQHTKIWEIVKATLKKVVPADAFPATEQRIQGFADAYGTVLFFEDYRPLQELEESFQLYADKFPDWSNHSSGIHQILVWLVLEEAGYGASLQHYNTLIDDEIKKEWGIPQDWKLVAQMPFGSKEGTPAEKQFKPLEERLMIYR